MPVDWLTTELAAMIAESLDFRAYTRLLSASKLTHAALLPGRAAVVYPHALAHMVELIKKECAGAEHPEFALEYVRGPNVALRSHCGGFQTLYGAGVCQCARRGSDILITVSRYRMVSVPESPSPQKMKFELGRARVKPDWDRPFAAGDVILANWVLNRFAGESLETTGMPAIRYTDGFHAILRALVYEMLPLRRSGE